jgi:hypothetical protein
MRKFSQLNESTKIDFKKIDSILADSELDYKIYDYYISGNELFKDPKNLMENSFYCNLIHIKRKYDVSSITIEDWNNVLKFNSSGFEFIVNIDSFKNFLLKFFEVIGVFKDNSPKFCIKDNSFLILLIGEKVPESELKLKEDLTKAYELLYNLLEDINKNLKDKGEEVIQEVTFWRQFNRLVIDFYDVSTSKYRRNPELLEDKTLSVLASLCTQMPQFSGDGYNWIDSQEKWNSYEEIRDEINDLGFFIKFKDNSKSQGGWRNSSYELILYEP